MLYRSFKVVVASTSHSIVSSWLSWSQTGHRISKPHLPECVCGEIGSSCALNFAGNGAGSGVFRRHFCTGAGVITGGGAVFLGCLLAVGVALTPAFLFAAQKAFILSACFFL